MQKQKQNVCRWKSKLLRTMSSSKCHIFSGLKLKEMKENRKFAGSEKENKRIGFLRGEMHDHA
jgi:hypothetical protein